MTSWGYSETNGPLTWSSNFPAAAGPRQSPVDINTAVATSDTGLVEDPLTWVYQPDKCDQIVNTGYGWRIDVDGSESELKGGPLKSVYKLEQFHCHWGSKSDEGSEHTVDGKAFAGELHLVHWNSEKYSSFKEAVGFDDGLAVLGIFFEVGDDDHEEIGKVVNLIPNVQFKGQIAKISDQIDPNGFLPGTNNYWTYLGSLTTPPCSESVIWIVFKDVIKVSERQLAAFRNLKIVNEEDNTEDDECRLLFNYRPPLPLGNRDLRECGPV